MFARRGGSDCEVGGLAGRIVLPWSNVRPELNVLCHIPPSLWTIAYECRRPRSVSFTLILVSASTNITINTLPWFVVWRNSSVVR